MFSDEMIREETHRAVSTMKSFIERPFTDAEAALGLHSFCLWMLQSYLMKHEGSQFDLDMHFNQPNVSARQTAIDYVNSLLDYDPPPLGVRRKFPSFAPEREVELALARVTPDSPEVAEWYDCLTRCMILMTRGIAYELHNDNLNAIEYLGINAPAELLAASSRWLAEAFDADTAEHLTSLVWLWVTCTRPTGPPLPGQDRWEFPHFIGLILCTAAIFDREPYLKKWRAIRSTLLTFGTPEEGVDELIAQCHVGFIGTVNAIGAHNNTDKLLQFFDTIIEGLGKNADSAFLTDVYTHYQQIVELGSGDHPVLKRIQGSMVWHWSRQQAAPSPYTPPARSPARRASSHTHTSSSECVAVGTRIMLSDGTTAPVETLRNGDRVLTLDVRSGQLKVRPIRKITAHPPVPVTTLYLADGSALTLTPAHRVRTSSAWPHASTLRAGDTLLCHGLGNPARWVRVSRVESSPPAAVFNLCIAETCAFFADGVLTHSFVHAHGIRERLERLRYAWTHGTARPSPAEDILRTA